ncbi:hypothetical protein D3C80_1781270 [compost metagenome]
MATCVVIHSASDTTANRTLCPKFYRELGTCIVLQFYSQRRISSTRQCLQAGRADIRRKRHHASTWIAVFGYDSQVCNYVTGCTGQDHAFTWQLRAITGHSGGVLFPYPGHIGGSCIAEWLAILIAHPGG